MLRNSLPLLMLFLFLGSFSLNGYSQQAGPKPNDLFAQIGKIHGENSIDEQGYVSIGGIKQWISVRGRNKDNPILLFLHGGPGFTTSPVAYYYMRDWEEYFTVVQWDQRGAGKTYDANDADQVKKTLSVDRLVLDAEDLSAYLRKKYGKRKIILMAHSFGTILGVKLAQKHPDWFYAYVGMGQFVNFARSERWGYEQTLAAAKKDNNTEAVKELISIAPFPDPKNPQRNLENLGKERRWLATYGGYYWESKFGSFNEVASMSPVYSEAELKLRNEAQAYSDTILWAELGGVDLSGIKNFGCPMIIFQGRHDLGTASFLVDEWFSTINAPSKKLIWFENSSHMLYEEAPGKTLVTLVNQVLPLTQ